MRIPRLLRAAVRLKIPRGGRGQSRGLEITPIIASGWMRRRESFSMWVRMDGDDGDPNLLQRVGRIAPSKSPRERGKKRAKQQVETVGTMSQVGAPTESRVRR